MGFPVRFSGSHPRFAQSKPLTQHLTRLKSDCAAEWSFASSTSHPHIGDFSSPLLTRVEEIHSLLEK